MGKRKERADRDRSELDKDDARVAKRRRDARRDRKEGRRGRPKEPALRPLMDQESFRREVVRTAALSDFEADPAAFADTLWPGVRRLAESAFTEGTWHPDADNPYAL